MPIDNCPYSFKELSQSVLPKHYGALESAMKSPTKAQVLVGYKSVSKELLLSLNRSADFPGCYVFISPNTWAFPAECSNGWYST